MNTLHHKHKQKRGVYIQQYIHIPYFFSFYSLPTHPQKNWIFLYSHSYSAFIISLRVFLVGWVVMGYIRTFKSPTRSCLKEAHKCRHTEYGVQF